MSPAEAQRLIAAAQAIQGEFALTKTDLSAASVASALMSASGAVYTGVCLDLACGIGFCAEHAAVAEMLKHRETDVAAIVAVGRRGVVPPCGRCRELLAQLSPSNLATLVILDTERWVPLGELLPEPWMYRDQST